MAPPDAVCTTNDRGVSTGVDTTPFCDQSLGCGVSPALHRLATPTVVNVPRDDDRRAVRVTTWLYCRFRECPPESTDTTAGLMVEIRLDMSTDQQLSGALPGCRNDRVSVDQQGHEMLAHRIFLRILCKPDVRSIIDGWVGAIDGLEIAGR